MSTSKSNSTGAVAMTKALADPVRWQIVELLSDGPRSASDLGAGFDISAPAISRHLKVLLGGGIVEVESHGRQRVYSLRADAIARLVRDLSSLVGESVAEVPAVSSRLRASYPRARVPEWRTW